MKKYAKEFRLSTAPQRSEQWYKERAGLPSASGLGFLFDTLKDGFTPSATAKKYLRQLAFERKFGVTFENFVTKPMKDGIFFEDFAKQVYEKETGNNVDPACSYVSDWFVATPDAFVTVCQPFDTLPPGETRGLDFSWGKTLKITVGDKKPKPEEGLLECKIVGDATFMELMEEGIPIEHELQTQSQLMASGLDWVDYIVVNLKTKAYFILRIKRNNRLIKRIYERLHEPLDLPELKDVGVKRFDENMLQSYMGNNNLIEEDTVILNLPF